MASGDRLQLKGNARAKDGRQLANGEIVTVKGVEADGRIHLQDGRTLDTSYRQFVRGYAVTSYAAQGKTADFVIFSDSAIRAATNQKQWYVTISRGRRGIEIFTTDKQELRENVIRSDNRELAMELTQSAKQPPQWRHSRTRAKINISLAKAGCFYADVFSSHLCLSGSDDAKLYRIDPLIVPAAGKRASGIASTLHCGGMGKLRE